MPLLFCDSSQVNTVGDGFSLSVGFAASSPRGRAKFYFISLQTSSV